MDSTGGGTLIGCLEALMGYLEAFLRVLYSIVRLCNSMAVYIECC